MTRAPKYLTDGPVVREFWRRNLRHTEGHYAGRPFEAEGWQSKFLDEAFLIDPRTGRRVYWQIVEGMPKKNGKTTKAAGISLFGLSEDRLNGVREMRPQVLLAAAARDQAALCGNTARAMVKSSRQLRRALTVRQRDILNPKNEGVLRWIASDSSTAQGVGPSFSVTDELGMHKDERLYETILQSGIGREQPFHLAITHTGWDRYGVLGDIYDRAMRHPKLEVYGGKGRPKGEPALMIVRDREDGFLFWWYGLGDRDDLDPEDPATWMACNPASWLNVDEIRKLKAGVRESNFRRFNLNAWVSTIESFLPAGEWQRLADPELVIPRGARVYLGIDTAKKYDMSAIIVNAPYRDSAGRVQHQVIAYIFEADEGKSSMKARVKAKVRDLARRYDVREAHFDPYRFDSEAEELLDEGIEMVEFHQSHSRMVPATQNLYEAVNDGRIRHDGDRELAGHLANAITVETERGNRLDKKKSKHKIDAAVACAMAVDAAENAFARGDHDSDGPQIVMIG
jgi:phage terminase large subunit-like protein